MTQALEQVVRDHMPGITPEHSARFIAALAAVDPLAARLDCLALVGTSLTIEQIDDGTYRSGIDAVDGGPCHPAIGRGSTPSAALSDLLRHAGGEPPAWRRACWSEVQRLEKEIADLRRDLEGAGGA